MVEVKAGRETMREKFMFWRLRLKGSAKCSVLQFACAGISF